MKNRELLLGVALAAVAAAAAFWFLKRRNVTLLRSGKLYSADPAYAEAAY